MRILLGHSYYKYQVDVQKWVEAWLARLRAHEFMVDSFCLTLNPPGPRLKWRDLEARWRRGDKELLTMYDDLARRLEDYDIFVNWNGINLHPDFVRQMPTFNVYGCFDDPELSDDLSRPVAWAYDLCMVGNIAELETYRKWGVKEVRFWPMGFLADDHDPTLTREKILHAERDMDVAMLCERTTPWRRERLDRFTRVFPQGAYYGNGWPNGFLPEKQRVSLLQRTKLGINIHNSTGPINFRTYYLPANGVMQVCDNKSHLGKIFELNKEVVGFDTIDEAIELCRYYLAHDDERRQIAAAGWERALRDYNEIAIFKLLVKSIEELRPAIHKRKQDVTIYLHSHRRQTVFQRAWYLVKKSLKAAYRGARSNLAGSPRHAQAGIGVKS